MILRISLLVLIVLLFGCSKEAEQKSQERSPKDAVRVSFNEYKSCLRQASPEEVSDWITESTFAYYQQCIDFALKANRRKMKSLPYGQMLIVLMLRLKMSLEEVQALNGKSLFEHSIRAGWTDKESMVIHELGSVTIEGDSAEGDIISAGKTTEMKWSFKKESGKWKIDLESFMQTTEKALAETIKQNDMPYEDLLKAMIKNVPGQSYDRDPWQPLLQE